MSEIEFTVTKTKTYQKELIAAFEVMSKIYDENQKRTGMVTLMPFAYAKNYETGELIVYSRFSKFSDEIQGILKEKYGIGLKEERWY